ncbi:hypothetical protein KYK31_23930 [Hymenobacter norwichensis]|nr:hypothetical protein [Hymenobacter norwichensis]
MLAELEDTIRRAEALYSSVCFWSIGPNLLPSLSGLLSKRESFCVADIHLPTNIDNLNLFHQAGANMFLFFKELRPKRPDAYLERHLLHTKMLLFDLPGGDAELWVGSHNFTKQALKGINREASLVIPCQQGDAIYTQALDYLQSIRADSNSRRFDPSQINNYKRLQELPPDETEGSVYVLPVSWHSQELTDLAQQVILLAGNDPKEYAQFAALSSALSNDNAQLAIQALDLDGGPVRRFTATIHNQGIISPTDPATYEIAFGERRLVSRIGTRLPLIAALSEEHTTGALRRFGYWVSVRIGDEIHEKIQFEDATIPAKADWKADKEDSALIFSELGEEMTEYNTSYNAKASYDALGYYRADYGGGYFPDENPSQAAQERVARWLERARQRKVRTTPAEPTVATAVFDKPQLPRRGSLALLKEQFDSVALSTLVQQYESPILEATLGSQSGLKGNDSDTKLLEVKKLLKRQVIR